MADTCQTQKTECKFDPETEFRDNQLRSFLRTQKSYQGNLSLEIQENTKLKIIETLYNNLLKHNQVK